MSLHDRDRQTPRRQSCSGRDRREQRNENDRDEILDDENAEDDLAQAFPELCSRRTPRAMIVVLEIATIAPVKTLSSWVNPRRWPTQVAEPDHRHRLEQGCEPRRFRDLRDFLKPELETEREHQEDDAELGQRLKDSFVGGQRNRADTARRSFRRRDNRRPPEGGSAGTGTTLRPPCRGRAPGSREMCGRCPCGDDIRQTPGEPAIAAVDFPARTLYAKTYDPFYENSARIRRLTSICP